MVGCSGRWNKLGADRTRPSTTVSNGGTVIPPAAVGMGLMEAALLAMRLISGGDIRPGHRRRHFAPVGFADRFITKKNIYLLKNTAKVAPQNMTFDTSYESLIKNVA